MNKQIIFLILLVCFGKLLHAQHHFTGHIDNERWQNAVYLSVIEDYRTLKGINEEQIITKVSTDATGYFEFNGSQLDATNKIYKLHVDNCSLSGKNTNHFDGHCEDSKSILFIAKENDSIVFPLGFEDQIFCDVRSTNPKTSAFIKIDSLKEDMSFEYGTYRSKANRKLNNKKWFKILHDFGETLDEPLAELYIYAFLSDRGLPFHTYYLQDLNTNNYYDELLERLKRQYPKSTYAKQYEAELKADRFITASTSKKTTASQPIWVYIIAAAAILSLFLNIWLIYSKHRLKSKRKTDRMEQLTSQEQKILDLIRQGKNNKAIAEILFVSVSTVKTHVNNIFRKLNVSSREEAKSLL
ncbi:response regulator transcription factor [Sediminibacter sp. Hel_I_10]|uniref:response regulator transcription factor n=1 Tax=Sediminibacter sp. Hel_I_10 TaxID=1392490 RepID=UPI00055CD849|nr:response regulator transcription factor [Sediminibacter sp. Hel_I_10]